MRNDGIDLPGSPGSALQKNILSSRKAELGKELFNAFRKPGPASRISEDEGITEIMINGTKKYLLNGMAGSISRTSDSAVEGKLEDVIQQIVAGSNRLVNEASPIVDARLADGSRVIVALAPVAVNGPMLRDKKIWKKMPLPWITGLHGIPSAKKISVFLATLVAAGYNISISGGTGSGKTTFLNALSQYIQRMKRIITIEDNAELKLQETPLNLVSLEARNPNVEGQAP